MAIKNKTYEKSPRKFQQRQTEGVSYFDDHLALRLLDKTRLLT